MEIAQRSGGGRYTHLAGISTAASDRRANDCQEERTREKSAEKGAWAAQLRCCERQKRHGGRK